MDRLEHMQNLRICKLKFALAYAKFAYMQIEICTWSLPGANFKNGANFAYVCKSIHVSILAYMQIFAQVCNLSM